MQVLELHCDYVIDCRPDPDDRIRKLMAAIMLQSLYDLRLRSQRADVIEWIYSNDNEYLFNFLHICHILDLDAKQIQAMVKNPSFRVKIP